MQNIPLTLSTMVDFFFLHLQDVLMFLIPDEIQCRVDFLLQVVV